jgi:acetylornithine aminotransferase
MRAGVTTIEVMEEEGLMDRAAHLGAAIMSEIARGMADTGGLVEVRGRGLMIGIELDRPCGELVRMALEAGLILNVTAERVVRLLPPLIFEQAHADLLVERLLPLLRRVVSTPPPGKA